MYRTLVSTAYRCADEKTDLAMNLNTMFASQYSTNIAPSRSKSTAKSSAQRLKIAFGLLWLSFACASQASISTPALPDLEKYPEPLRLKMQSQLRPLLAVAENVDAPPTPAPDARLRTWVEQERRLYRVAAPLLLNNAELCKHHAGPLPGFTIKNKFSYSPALVAAAGATLGLGERLRVMLVLPGSGAEKNGVHAGDIITAVNDEPVQAGAYAEQKALAMLDVAMSTNSLKLKVLRDETPLVHQVPLARGCAFRIELGNSGDVNSYSDSHRVLITQGMLDFVRSDEELAYVLAKEIAHAAINRRPRPRMAALIDRLRLPDLPHALPAADRPEPYTPVLDATADKLSLYMLARAGYDYAGALDFWQKLAAQYPAELSSSHTALHPSTSYRVSVMSRVIEHIRDKKRMRRPLVP